MRSFIVVTDNSEKYIKDVLCSLLPLEKDEELIIFDNMSTDNTVPLIVSTMGVLWIDEENKYKFYINKTKESIEVVTNKALSIAKYQPVMIKNKSKFKIEEVLKDVENK